LAFYLHRPQFVPSAVPAQPHRLFQERFMTRVDLAREQTDHLLDHLLRVLDRTILRIPPEQMDFRPTPDNMSAAQMAHHVYRVVLMSYRAVELGRLERDDLEGLAMDEEEVRRAEDLVDWGNRVKDHARKVAAQLTEEQLERDIHFHFGLSATGWDTLRTALEETVHHRGQLMMYLRLMGIKPPRVNDAE
jgi:uncharacterized damage-inducible protein DinB